MLYIYKASAGSGKTHLLTGFFLRLLFNRQPSVKEDDRPLLFNEILAVTFTNKATAEMKERIIDDLNILCKDPAKSDYIDDLMTPDTNGKKPTIEEIKRKASNILHAMLNDYSDLHVSTIDSFFQQILRSFAHELNVQGNYEIELDANEVLDQVVGQFILNLNPTKDKETFQWMLEFASQRINEGSGWNVHEELLKLAKVLTSESYKQNSQRIAEFTSNREALRGYIGEMKAIQKEWKDALKETGQQGLELLRSLGVDCSDFKGGSRSSMFCFNKWAQGDTKEPTDTLIAWAESTEDWYKKASQVKAKLTPSDESNIQDLLRKGIELLTGNPRICYESARAISKNIFQLGLLSRLEAEANRYCEEKGIQLLSNTTQVLNSLIQDEESPFIYEKTGTRIQSFMIDEFQDTSILQWNNFKPLLKNSLGTGNENLIVGDVKQSIYRWRGSDWELLNSTIYDFCKDLQKYDKDHNQLLYNFRSDRKIIDFNNEFFAYASKHLSEVTGDPIMAKIAAIYADVEQKVHEKREATIGDGILHYEEVSAEGEGDADDAILQKLPEMVIALQQKGFAAKDILILGRFNKDCNIFAETLLNYKKLHPECRYNLNIITDEALSLGNRDIIRAIVAMLQAINEPKSEMCRAIAHCCYLKASGLDMPQAIAAHFKSEGNGQQTTFPDYMQFSNLPLFEMVEGLVSVFPQEKQRDSLFLQSFRDLVLDHVAKRGTDLGGFLKWWNEKGCSQSISTPANQDAIRIMTIHQSKGLGEKAVIIPLANWQIDIDTSHGEILWLDPKGMGYTPEEEEKPIILPICLESTLSKTIFKEEYAQERMRAIIDNLNTAYVAFTRAKKAMVIMAPAPKKENKALPDLAMLLKTFMSGWEARLDKLEMLEEEPECIISPEKESALPAEHHAVTGNIQNQPKIKKSIFLNHNPETARGTAIHNALSAVSYADDFELPIRQLFRSGQARLEGFTIEELIATVRNLIHQPKTAAWFQRGNRILNEQNIVTHTTHTQRPDRIVITPDNKVFIIDYKTGKTHSHRYHSQVEHYIRLMQDMGFKQVEGYLWYLDQDRIEKVIPASESEQLTLDFS